MSVNATCTLHVRQFGSSTMRVWAIAERLPMCLLSTPTADAGGGGEGAGRLAMDTG